MKLKKLILGYLFIPASLLSQQKMNYGIQLLSGFNSFTNAKDVDEKYFSFKNPITFGGGLLANYKFNDKNELVLNATFRQKKIKLENRIHEESLDIHSKNNFIFNFNSIGLAINYKRNFNIGNIPFNSSVGIFADLNFNNFIAVYTAMSHPQSFDTITTHTEMLTSTPKDQKKLVYGGEINIGTKFKENSRLHLEIYSQIPFSKIMNEDAYAYSSLHTDFISINQSQVINGKIFQTGIRLNYYFKQKIKND